MDWVSLTRTSLSTSTFIRPVRYILMPTLCQAFAKDSANPKVYYRLTRIERRQPTAKAVNCPCGETVTADTDDELVRMVQAHWKEVHNQEVSREDALAMAQPVE